MPTCNICTLKKRKAYILCAVCDATEKRICLHCWSSLLHMCPATNNCTRIHLTCPYCKIEIKNKGPLIQSEYYLKQCLSLTKHQLKRVLYDRELATNYIAKIEHEEILHHRKTKRLAARLRNDRTRLQNGVLVSYAEESMSD